MYVARKTAGLKAHDRAKNNGNIREYLNDSLTLDPWLDQGKCHMDPWALSGIHPFSPFNPGEDWVVNTAEMSKTGSDVCCVACGQRQKLRGYTREESCWSAPPLVFSLVSIFYRFLLEGYPGGDGSLAWLAEHCQCCLIPVLTPYSVQSQASLALPSLSFSRCWTKVAVRLICLPGQQWGMLSMCEAHRRWNHNA